MPPPAFLYFTSFLSKGKIRPVEGLFWTTPLFRQVLTTKALMNRNTFCLETQPDYARSTFVLGCAYRKPDWFFHERSLQLILRSKNIRDKNCTFRQLLRLIN